MKNKEGAILVLTRRGAETGIRLARKLPGATLYLPARFRDEVEGKQNCCCIGFYHNWRETVANLFQCSSFIIFVSAAGIAVRSIAPLLVNKYSDPAVLVVDEEGRYSISLLSGHVGGGNYLSRKVAQILDGEPVITTATDIRGCRYPPDMLAAYMGVRELPADLAKEFNRLVAEGETVYLYSPFSLVEGIRREYCWCSWPGDDNFAEPAVVVSPYRQKVHGKILLIKPSCLVVGIGCRKGVLTEAVRSAVQETLRLYNLDDRCIKALATVDLKVEEEALQEYRGELGVPLFPISRDAIKTLAGTYPASCRVEKELGVGGVCEPAARLAGEGLTLVPKQKHGPVTVSVALAKSWWWAWDRETGNC